MTPTGLKFNKNIFKNVLFNKIFNSVTLQLRVNRFSFKGKHTIVKDSIKPQYFSDAVGTLKLYDAPQWTVMIFTVTKHCCCLFFPFASV